MLANSQMEAEDIMLHSSSSYWTFIFIPVHFKYDLE